ncbi:hypothetical protein [Nonomuraea fuscirosea]|uniref:hypothetical protein n=1 Tax=Nonomuraea fuscirosea TaxID=1291556 RepID=UPI00342F4A45
MMSVGLARKAAAFGASAAMLAGLAAGLVASPAQAATTATASAAGKAAAKPASKLRVSVSTPKASPRAHDGSCPVKVDFSARIRVPVKGKTVLAYRWLHGDGSKSKVKVVRLKGKSTKTVTVKQSITFKEDVKGWEAVQVLGPKKFTSKKGRFAVSCEQPRDDDRVRTHLDRTVSATAWASPSRYVGPCTPGDKIDFVGRIETSRPTWVRYRWVLNGDVVDSGKIKVRDSRRVGFGISPRHSGDGYAQLQVLGRDGAYSNRAYYKVWCKDSAPDHPEPVTKVSAGATVVNVNCTVNASAVVTSTGAGRVGYVWKLNGSVVTSGDTYFGRNGGSKSISGFSSPLSGDARKGGTVTLSVSGPNNRDHVVKSYSACAFAAPKSTPTPTPTPTHTPEPTTPA